MRQRSPHRNSRTSACISSLLSFYDGSRRFSGKSVIKKLTKLGYVVVRQRGSHVRLKHRDSLLRRPLMIPVHKEIKVGLLKQILKDAGLEDSSFLDL